jgi:ATP-dependent Clp protease adaptor protein ClpS
MAEKDPPSPPPPPPAAPDGAGSSGAATAQKENRKESQKTKAPARPRVDHLPPYNVVLLNDEEHTYEYVIEMLGKLFGYDEQKAFRMAREVDQSGRVIVLTTHKERAELKRDQITGFGADVRMDTSKGSMSAVIEPAN